MVAPRSQNIPAPPPPKPGWRGGLHLITADNPLDAHSWLRAVRDVSLERQRYVPLEEARQQSYEFPVYWGEIDDSLAEMRRIASGLPKERGFWESLLEEDPQAEHLELMRKLLWPVLRSHFDKDATERTSILPFGASDSFLGEDTSLSTAGGYISSHLSEEDIQRFREQGVYEAVHPNTLWSEPTAPTLVHESMHAGIDLLRDKIKDSEQYDKSAFRTFLIRMFNDAGIDVDEFNRDLNGMLGDEHEEDALTSPEHLFVYNKEDQLFPGSVNWDGIASRTNIRNAEGAKQIYNEMSTPIESYLENLIDAARYLDRPESGRAGL